MKKLEEEEALLGREVVCVWIKVRLALDTGSQSCQGLRSYWPSPGEFYREGGVPIIPKHLALDTVWAKLREADYMIIGSLLIV